ncbi:CocE/NonD family hydrolase C-terminal non-catalytic domain-containing protein [Streptococcus sp. SK643]|uniref:CocE/NonD family hydrolase C-terminal non-catalytic domain-containing protein n=1 Tax=Streptococcus sp. SK643 TaxID=1095727 RepID=UPI0009D9400F
MDIHLELQPIIYKLEEGYNIRLVLYTTDFEMTIRDNTAYHLTVDLAQSMLTLPCQKE